MEGSPRIGMKPNRGLPLPWSQRSDKEVFVDHRDHFTNSAPESEWKACLDHAEKIGLGTRRYELVAVK